MLKRAWVQHWGRKREEWWGVEGGRWRVGGGGWRVEDGGWRVGGKKKVVHELCCGWLSHVVQVVVF